MLPPAIPGGKSSLRTSWRGQDKRRNHKKKKEAHAAENRASRACEQGDLRSVATNYGRTDSVANAQNGKEVGRKIALLLSTGPCHAMPRHAKPCPTTPRLPCLA